MADMTEDIRQRITELTAALAEMRIKSALVDQHVVAQEAAVRDFMQRTEAKMESLDKKMDVGDQKMDVRFDELRKSNEQQMAILTKWGTIRDTLMWVCGVAGVFAGAVWAVFLWVTGHLWGKP